LVVSHITPIKILLCQALDVPLTALYRMYLGSAASMRSSGTAAISPLSGASLTPAT
jgi:hypothetical protein